jgi:hypothetical protein
LITAFVLAVAMAIGIAAMNHMSHRNPPRLYEPEEEP